MLSNQIKLILGRAIGTALVIIIILMLLAIPFYIKRTFNNALYYDSATEQKICEMVQPNYLNEGYCDEK